MTPVDLIRLALKTSGVVGIGQTPDAEDTNDVFTVLNGMLAQWSRKRWLCYHLVDLAHTSTGAQSYTIGTGGNFDVTRPDKIHAAYVRILPIGSSGGVDVPLQIIDAREDYSSVAVKSLTSFPNCLFYDSDYPLGVLHFYPVPNTSFELHVVIKETISQFPTLTTPINLPPEYTQALIFSLANIIRPMYQLPPDPSIVVLAKTSLNAIRGANAQIPLLSMPMGIPRHSGGRYPGHGIASYGF